MSSAEQRRQRRIPVELWIEAERGGELYFQRASNLSVGGAFFTQTVPLPVGTRVQLRFSLPKAKAKIRCEAEIVATKELGMGVEFRDLKPADRAKIEALIAATPEDDEA